jgi:hypothetical protein
MIYKSKPLSILRIAVVFLFLLITVGLVGGAQQTALAANLKGTDEFNSLCADLHGIDSGMFNKYCANLDSTNTQAKQNAVEKTICDKYGNKKLKSDCSSYSKAIKNKTSSSSGTSSDSSSATDPGYQLIFDQQICPALQQKVPNTTLDKYCKDYPNQDDLDNAYHKICDVHGSGGDKKLSSACDAYKNYSKGSFQPGVGASGSGDPAADPNAKCNNNDCDFIKKFINPAINTLSACFGIVAVISIILGGINYSTSEGDPQKASRAKNRILNTIIAVIAYIFLYAFLQFLVPGGAFK